MTLHARADRRYVRSGYRSNRFIVVDVVAPAVRRAPTREALNAAFVLDRSGSMAGQKLSLARQAIDASIGSLADTDRFAVVAYDDRVDVVSDSRPATGDARHTALEALSGIDARGSTNLFEGWMRGCEQVATHQDGSGMHRVLLMSDGLANVGVTDREEIVSHAEELRRRGVATWTFGFGSDFDEDLMERMAVAGGGQSFYVESPLQIRDYVTNAVGEALDVVARDVRVKVRAGEGVLVEPLSLFRGRREGDSTFIELGDMVSEQRLRLVLRLNFPFGTDGQVTLAHLSLGDREGVLDPSSISIEWEYADNRTNDLQPRDRDVDREVARLFAARARKEATEFNKQGSFKLAAERLNAVARRIEDYAGDDPELNRIAIGLREDRQTVAAPMAPQAQKLMHYQSSYEQRSRDAAGRAMKGQQDPDRPR